MIYPMTALGQKLPKLPWLPAAKSGTEQRVKFVPKVDPGRPHALLKPLVDHRRLVSA